MRTVGTVHRGGASTSAATYLLAAGDILQLVTRPHTKDGAHGEVGVNDGGSICGVARTNQRMAPSHACLCACSRASGQMTMHVHCCISVRCHSHRAGQRRRRSPLHQHPRALGPPQSRRTCTHAAKQRHGVYVLTNERPAQQAPMPLAHVHGTLDCTSTAHLAHVCAHRVAQSLEQQLVGEHVHRQLLVAKAVDARSARAGCGAHLHSAAGA